MANIASAKTRIKHNRKRAEINSVRLSAVKTQIRKTQDAIKAGDKNAAQASFNETQSALARAGQKGALNKKTAARKVSRLAAAIKAI